MKDTNPHLELRELIRQLERKLGMLNESKMACCQITMAQCHALVEIGRAKQTSLIELSDVLRLENSTMSRTVNHLVNAELVNRNIDANDRRYVTISLTEDGQKIFEGIESGMNIYFKRILNGIPLEKQEQVLESLRIILNAFEALEKEEV